MMYLANLTNTVRTTCKRFITNERGSIATAFALIVPLIIAASGMAIDLSNAYKAKNRLGQALDAAALAAASGSGDYDERYDRLTKFIDRNYTTDVYKTPAKITMALEKETLYASAETTIETSFMRMFGKDEMKIFAETEVTLEVRGVEVVLVLDNTGSMGGQNIKTLREASKNFVNILFDAAAETEAVKIGLVPYATSVNVGPYGLGENPDGSFYDTAFVNNPHSLDYSTWDSNEWQGCVLAGDEPLDIQDHTGPWDMYRYCRDEDENPTCDSYWWYGTKYPRRDPNYVCPDSSILPLTSQKNDLINHIEDMNANGHTLGSYGLVWGWRVISPAFPFQEGTEYDDPEWDKVVLMMTDGINTMHPHYSAYGRTSSHSVSPNDLDEKMEDVCEAMKEEDIIVYTVTFESGVDNDTKDFFRRCATSEDKYFDAPSQDDLIQVFEKISRELSNLHLSR